MHDTSYSTTTEADVKEFRERLKKRDRERTPSQALQDLIRSGAFDAKGKPRWPTGAEPRAKSKTVAKKRK